MTLIQIIIATVLVNNLILNQYIGINPTIAASKNHEYTVTMGLAIMFLMTISTLLTKIVNDYILVPNSLGDFKIFAFVIVIALVIVIANTVLKGIMKERYTKMTNFMPIVVINNLFLGVALLVTQEGLGLVETVVYSIGVSLGFMLVSTLVSSISYKYRYANMPRHFLEKPITLIALGLIALAFYGFSGLV